MATTRSRQDLIQRINDSVQEKIGEIELNNGQIAGLLGDDWDPNRVRYRRKKLEETVGFSANPVEAVRSAIYMHIDHSPSEKQPPGPSPQEIDFVRIMLRYDMAYGAPTPIDVGQNVYDFLGAFNYLVPRISEQILSILFEGVPIPPHTYLIIPITRTDDLAVDAPIFADKAETANSVLRYFSRAFVAYVDEHRAIHPSIRTNPLVIEDKKPMPIIVDEITPSDAPYKHAFLMTDEGVEWKLPESETIRDCLTWLTHCLYLLAEERLRYNNPCAATIQTSQVGRDNRVAKILDWLIESANQHFATEWAFAVVLVPDDVKAPRYTQALETTACSTRAPYRHNQIKMEREGFSYQAYQTAQMVRKDREMAGTVKPTKYESDVQSLIAVPTVTSDSINGVLYVAANKPGKFGPLWEQRLALFALIIGELLSNTRNHRISNERNIRQILHNHRILSETLSLFKAREDLQDRLERMVAEVRGSEDDTYYIVIADLDESREMVEGYYLDDDVDVFSDQKSIDEFFRRLGAQELRGIIKSYFGDDGLEDEDDLEDEVYQLLLDRFVFIIRKKRGETEGRYFHDDEEIDKFNAIVNRHMSYFEIEEESSEIATRLTFGFGCVAYNSGSTISTGDDLVKFVEDTLREAKKRGEELNAKKQAEERSSLLVFKNAP